MADLAKKFKDILDEVENNISDVNQREFVNKKMVEVSMLYMEVIDEMTEIIKTKLDKIDKNQDLIETKLNKIQGSVSGIENDIYDEEGYEFEIICPYCNTEFVADVESKTDIKCPECQNIIELDWNGGDISNEDMNPCFGHCSSCGNKCGNSSFLDEFGDDINYIDDEDEDM